MQIKLRRYRWWLILACLAMVAIGWWQLSRTQGRFTRAQYDRIRLGMTPAEVAASMGCGPFGGDRFGHWQHAEYEASPAFNVFQGGARHDEEWTGESVGIVVEYSDGKAVMKQMWTRVPLWKDWLDWLRGLVGL